MRTIPSSRLVAHAVAVLAVVAGVVTAPTLVIGFVVCATVFIALERVAPLVPRAVLRPHLWVDLVHAFGNRLPISIGVGAVLAVLAAPLHALVPDAARAAVHALPAWAVFVGTLLLADLLGYWAHRALHEVPLLWRLHAVHHSVESMDWLATSRGHPLDQIINVVAVALPVAAFDIDLRVSTALVVVTFCYPFLAHANSRLTLRWLTPVFVTPAFHHWHHADEPAAVNRNYGNLFTFWDALFGTWHLPRRMPSAYGADVAMPDTWVGQMLYPFGVVATPTAVAGPPARTTLPIKEPS